MIDVCPPGCVCVGCAFRARRVALRGRRSTSLAASHLPSVEREPRAAQDARAARCHVVLLPSGETVATRALHEVLHDRGIEIRPGDRVVRRGHSWRFRKSGGGIYLGVQVVRQ
jgi:hypothetical protein